MHIEKQDLEWAASQGVIERTQVDALWHTLFNKTATRPRFDFVHVLYYFGALLVIGAMTWFMTSAWMIFGGGGIFIISVLYATAFIWVGSRLWRSADLRVPGGLLVTMAVCITPLAVYGLQRWLGIWGFDDPGEYKLFYS